MGRIRFALALHNHQPVGNFDGVIEAAYHDSYRPFLDVIEQYPEIPFCLHTSGCLMEWLADRKPEYIDRLKRLVERAIGNPRGGILRADPLHDSATRPSGTNPGIYRVPDRLARCECAGHVGPGACLGTVSRFGHHSRGDGIHDIGRLPFPQGGSIERDSSRLLHD